MLTIISIAGLIVLIYQFLNVMADIIITERRRKRKSREEWLKNG